jgi:hypothetical protein
LLSFLRKAFFLLNGGENEVGMLNPEKKKAGAHANPGLFI